MPWVFAESACDAPGGFLDQPGRVVGVRGEALILTAPLLTQSDLGEHPSEQLIHLVVDQGRHGDIFTVVLMGQPFAFCNDKMRRS